MTRDTIPALDPFRLRQIKDVVLELALSGKAALDKLIAQGGKDSKLPGFIFGATSAQGEMYMSRQAGLGILDDDPGKDDVFWICSQTKLITHLAALLLIERGQLHPDDAVSKYVPQFQNDSMIMIVKSEGGWAPAKGIVRVGQLLNCTSGMYYPLEDILPGRQMEQYCAEQQDVGAFFGLVKGCLPGIPFQFEPGTNFAYGFGSDVLGFVIEKVTGVTLEEYFKENIFDPLGMKSTSFYLSPELEKRKVPLTIWRDGKLEMLDPGVRVYEMDPAKVYLRLGGVGLYSTPRDYLTLLRHLLQIHDGTASKPVFSKEIVTSVFTPSLDEEAAKTFTRSQSTADANSPWGEGAQWSTALALNTTDWAGRRKKHSGSWYGWANTHHVIDPTSGVAAVLYMQMIDGEVGEFLAGLEKALYCGLDRTGIPLNDGDEKRC